MRSSTVSASAVLFSILKLASAQTFTDCNPLAKSTSPFILLRTTSDLSPACPSDPALGTSITTDFTKGASPDWTLAAGTTLSYAANGAEFSIHKSTDAPTISSTKYIFFGKVSVVTKAAPGTGIVSSFILESDDLDEIDWEWLGSTDSSVESNFFGKGNTTTYDRAVYHNVATPIETWHTYTIDWTASAVVWSIDGAVVRTLKYGDALALGGKNYPQTPMRVKMGSWIGCASIAAQADPKTAGTCTWAGGAVDFGKAPFVMYVKTVSIQDYGCGSEYTYGDNSGSWQSIQTTGNCGGNNGKGAGDSSASASQSLSSAGIFAQTSGTVSSLSPSATGASNSGSTASAKVTTMTSVTTSPTKTGSSASQSSSSATGSSAPAKASGSGAVTAIPKHKYGALDCGVLVLGLVLGYLVM